MAFTNRTRSKKNLPPHLIITAGPGSGKSTTLIAALNLALGGKKPSWFKFATGEQKDIFKSITKESGRVVMMAFNKAIQLELEQKVPSSVEAKTIHGFGNSVLRSHGYKFKPSGSNVDYMVKDMMGYDFKDKMSRDDFELKGIISKTVSLLKNNLLEPTRENILHLALTQGIEINGNINSVVDYSVKVMDKCKSIEPNDFRYIDFDDMLWLPIVLNLESERDMIDLLVVDEAQDLNPVQHEMVMRYGRRIAAVGDPRQAIYGFRGADSDSLNTMEKLLGSTKRGVQVLPLQTSFRLPLSGVKNVQEYAPDLTAAEGAIEGSINECFVSDVKPNKGDLIVSRINANIFGLAFKLLRERVPVRIQGREFGKELCNLIKKNCNMDDNAELVTASLSSYDSKERARIEKKTFPEKLLEVHSEKMNCLYSLISGCENAAEMIETIETLFSEDLKKENVVLLSTVHRAKGLEANTVYFLEPNLVPHPMAKRDEEIKQEYNLKFVAETRHLENLVYVHPNKDDDQRDEIEGRLVEDKSNDDLDHAITHMVDASADAKSNHGLA